MCFWFEIVMKIVSMGSIGFMSPLVGVMAWCGQAKRQYMMVIKNIMCLCLSYQIYSKFYKTRLGFVLTGWGRMTHIWVSKLAHLSSDNDLSPGRRQTTILTNDGILLIGPLETNLSEILIEIYTFSFKKIHLKMSSGKRRPFCPGLNV